MAATVELGDLADFENQPTTRALHEFEISNAAIRILEPNRGRSEVDAFDLNPPEAPARTFVTQFVHAELAVSPAPLPLAAIKARDIPFGQLGAVCVRVFKTMDSDYEAWVFDWSRSSIGGPRARQEQTDTANRSDLESTHSPPYTSQLISLTTGPMLSDRSLGTPTATASS